MKRRKQKQKNKIKKVAMTQEQAEVYYSETHLTEELRKRVTDETPDFLDLKLKNHHFVFVYGTLKTGERNTYLMEGCPYLGEGYVAVKGFDMKISKFGAFPIIFEARTQEDKKRAEHIKGEIYVVDPLKMLELDQLESNGVMYKREQRWIWMEDQRLTDKPNLKPADKCWVYIGNPVYWQGREMADYPSERKGDRTFYDFDGKTAAKIVAEKVKASNEVFNSWAYQGPEREDFDMFQEMPF